MICNAVGFTGTRDGMTDKQLKVFKELISKITMKSFHHGDCVGADTEAHKVLTELGVDVFIHPPINAKLRAFNKGKKSFEEKKYSDRNKDIVCACDFLIATPKTMDNFRGGTWQTIKYASGLGRSICVIDPDGNKIYIVDEKESKQ